MRELNEIKIEKVSECNVIKNSDLQMHSSFGFAHFEVDRHLMVAVNNISQISIIISEQQVDDYNLSLIYNKLKSLINQTKNYRNESYRALNDIHNLYCEDKINIKLKVVLLSATNSKAIKPNIKSREKLYDSVREIKINSLGEEKFQKSIYARFK